MEIKKVRAEGKILKITIPQSSGFRKGDYVAITKVRAKFDNTLKEKTDHGNSSS